MAGLKYGGDVTVKAAFTVTQAKPLDIRTVIQSADDRFNIPVNVAYEGMAVACINNGNIYILKDKNNINSALGWKASYETIQIKTCTKTQYEIWSSNTAEDFTPINPDLEYIVEETYYYIIQGEDDAPGDYYASYEQLEEIQRLLTSSLQTSVQSVNSKINKIEVDLKNYAKDADVRSTYTPLYYFDLDNSESYISKLLSAYYTAETVDQTFLTIADAQRDYVTKDLLNGGSGGIEGDNFVFVTQSTYEEDKAANAESFSTNTLNTSEIVLSTHTLKAEESLLFNEKEVALLEEVPKIDVLTQEEYDKKTEYDPDTYYYTYEEDSIILTKEEAQSTYSTKENLRALESEIRSLIQALEDKIVALENLHTT